MILSLIIFISAWLSGFYSHELFFCKKGNKKYRKCNCSGYNPFPFTETEVENENRGFSDGSK